MTIFASTIPGLAPTPVRRPVAAVEYDSEHHVTALGTDADGLGNIVTWARIIAEHRGARFVEPDACCEYCGRPVAADTRYCPSGDCDLMDGTRETAWWRDYPRTNGPLAPGNEWAA